MGLGTSYNNIKNALSLQWDWAQVITTLKTPSPYNLQHSIIHGKPQ